MPGSSSTTSTEYCDQGASLPPFRLSSMSPPSFDIGLFAPIFACLALRRARHFVRRHRVKKSHLRNPTVQVDQHSALWRRWTQSCCVVKRLKCQLAVCVPHVTGGAPA